MNSKRSPLPICIRLQDVRWAVRMKEQTCGNRKGKGLDSGRDCFCTICGLKLFTYKSPNHICICISLNATADSKCF